MNKLPKFKGAIFCTCGAALNGPDRVGYAGFKEQPGGESVLVCHECWAKKPWEVSDGRT